jgi:hypothetical protein
MTLSATDAGNVLSINDFLSLADVFANWRNSKGRLMPLHLMSAPGMGKSMLTHVIAESMARQHPGEPVGMGVSNPGLKDPAGVAGFNIFGDVDGVRTSINTRPDIFRLQYAIVFDADSGDLHYIHESATGAALFPNSEVVLPNGSKARIRRGVLLMDEFMQADPEVRKVLAPLLDEGRVGDHTLPRDFLVMACSNRAQDKSGVGKGLAFITNRWCQITLESSFSAVAGFLQGEPVTNAIRMSLSMDSHPLCPATGKVLRNPNNVDEVAHKAVIRWLEQNQEVLFRGVPADPGLPFLTPRSAEATSNLFDIMLRLPVADEHGKMDASLSYTDSYVARDNSTLEDSDGAGESTGVPGIERCRLFHALASGTIGSDNATQLLATVELFDEVPTPAQVQREPLKARISKKSDARFITGQELSRAMRQDNADAFITYMQREGFEASIRDNAIINAMNRDGYIMLAPKVNEFISKNQDVMARMYTAQARAGLATSKRA